MGVEARLIDDAGRAVCALPDPSGGTFDAAGEFDRLIGSLFGGVLNDVDLHGVTSFAGLELGDLLADVASLLALDSSGAERRGLQRLQTLAVEARSRGGTITFAGD